MAQSYANPGGTGDRRAFITASTNYGVSGGNPPLLVDGGPLPQFSWFVGGNPANTGNYFEFDLGSLGAQKISKVRWITGDNRTFGNHDWQGWNGAAWVTLNSFVLHTGAVNTATNVWKSEHVVSDAAAYTKFRLIGTGGTFVNTYLFEIEFEISALVAGLDLAAALTDDAALAAAISFTAPLNLAAALVDEATMAATLALGDQVSLSAAFIDESELAAEIDVAPGERAPPVQTVVVLGA